MASSEQLGQTAAVFEVHARFLSGTGFLSSSINTLEQEVEHLPTIKHPSLTKNVVPSSIFSCGLRAAERLAIVAARRAVNAAQTRPCDEFSSASS
jgi:hypothetical protein